MATRAGRHRRPGRVMPVLRAGRASLAAGGIAAGTFAAAAHGQPAYAAAAVAAAYVSDETAAAVPEVTVRPGDTLSLIAQRYCGTSADWPGIYAASRAVIGGNWNDITPGELLVIRCAPGPLPSSPGSAETVSATQVTTGMSSFQQCVITRESGGDATAVNPSTGAGGLYGFLPSTWAALGFPGLPEDAPVWEQDEAFDKAYELDGTSPWAPYDGC
jgi:hypothetical protein